MTVEIYGQVTRYPVLRSVLREDLAVLDDASLAQEVAAGIPGMTADELEFSFSNLGRTLGAGLSQVGNVAARAGPGALTGAMQGATMGAALGPYGMLAGAALGAVGGGITSYSQSQQQQQPGVQRQQHQPGVQQQQQPQQTAVPAAPTRAAPAPTYPTPPQVPALPNPPVSRPAGQAADPSLAIARLLQILARPEFVQAILALSAGALGRRRIEVAGHSVAPAEMLGVLEYVVSGGGNTAQFNGYAENWNGNRPVAAQIYEQMAASPAESHPFGQILGALQSGRMPDAPAVPRTDFEHQENYAAFGY